MTDPVNPLMPAAYDIVWTGASVIVLTIVVSALVSLFRHARWMDRVERVIWLIVVLALPVIGAILWFTSGRPKVRREAGLARASS